MEQKNKINIKNLVISQALSKRLVDLGLHKIAAFHWLHDIDFGDENPEKKWMIIPDAELDDYGETEVLPAWTYEELRIMIGWEYNGIELREPRPKPISEMEQFDFLVIYPTLSKAFQIGAEANGEWLAYLLQNKKETPEDVNKRYQLRFKPE